jgi:phosphate uptake regulator
VDALDCLEYQTLVGTIERIGDHATSIAESARAATGVLSDVVNIRECLRKISHHAARIAELTIDGAYRVNTD